jgi:signal recognition particle receptor subunit beta
MSWKVDIDAFITELLQEAKLRNIVISITKNNSRTIDPLSQISDPISYSTINIKHQSHKFPNEETQLKSAKEILDEINVYNAILSIVPGQIGVWESYFIRASFLDVSYK